MATSDEQRAELLREQERDRHVAERSGLFARRSASCFEEIRLRHQAETRAAQLRDEKATLRDILARLVAAKDEKDANGETGRYRELKAGAWDRAREILAEIA